jgi:methylphosphotriester-DNA--protein-cysteine methyltransferase
MTYQHRELAAGKWNRLSFAEQMANVGSEVERTIAWKVKEQPEYSRRAFERALELLDLTIADAKNRTRLRELLRVREALADHFAFDNIYQSSHEAWQRYFRFFLMAARGNR